MNTTTFKIREFVIIDVIAILFLYLMPTISHLMMLPLYKCEPMRCALLLNLWFLGDRKNAYFMAITLPLFSFLIGGHPVFVKSFVMAAELLINVLLFFNLSKNINNSLAMFFSILISKVAYYGMKYICIFTGLLTTSLVDTSIAIQLLVMLMISLFYLKPTKY